MNRKSAFTLIELLVVLTSCSVILTTSAVLMHRVLRVQARSRSFTDMERSAVRLSAQFRSDVNQAVAMQMAEEVGEEGSLLSLQMPSKVQVEYHRQDGRVQRTVVKEGSVQARDEFVIPTGSQLSIREDKDPHRLTLTLASPRNMSASGDHAPLAMDKGVVRHLEVVAVVGRRTNSYKVFQEEETSE